MSASKDGISGVSWFWGIVLSLSLHIVIFLVAIFWGFGPMYSGEPESIEGTLVSISELGQPGGEGATKEDEKIVLQEKKKEKKEIAKKPETTEPPKTKPSKEIEKKKEAFKEVKNSEEEMNKVIQEIRQQKLLKELKDKRVASSDSSGEQKGIQKGAGY